jgi:hypothetical protein
MLLDIIKSLQEGDKITSDDLLPLPFINEISSHIFDDNVHLYSISELINSLVTYSYLMQDSYCVIHMIINKLFGLLPYEKEEFLTCIERMRRRTLTEIKRRSSPRFDYIWVFKNEINNVALKEITNYLKQHGSKYTISIHDYRYWMRYTIDHCGEVIGLLFEYDQSNKCDKIIS